VIWKTFLEDGPWPEEAFMPDDRIRKQYGIDDILAHLPEDAAHFYSGFAPWPEDLEGWTRTTHELLPADGERVLTRTVWDLQTDRESRLLVDVTECGSASDAAEALADSLEANQLASLPAGLRGTWFVSFVHPEGAPPASFLAYANLLILITSFGRKSVSVEPLVKRLLQRLETSSKTDTTFGRLTAEPDRPRRGQEVLLRYELNIMPIEDSYFRFSVTGGTILRRQGQFILRPASAGRMDVSSWLFERGRETRSSSLTIPVE
jgi:hypothetical protein